ncbi:hypothetical protein [Alkalilimnicola sp. S0819]|uniref:hypothetical protein n=1 Tax=Alkalilimnicola sp. S0819 TaxID=2613922 RepID=UPI001261A2CC|nr:hypothetical protein [Alkalilimnicola sp. S0819]KAB7623928.1 hypothetical protein F3N43_07730 [Alkalilimnicola sp. S0819]MPQ16525.1 hypothetical protein [Alkalilimnicola sp. S0819]
MADQQRGLEAMIRSRRTARQRRRMDAENLDPGTLEELEDERHRPRPNEQRHRDPMNRFIQDRR